MFANDETFKLITVFSVDSAIVEVADFNFGDVGNDMEYKSFRQRLVESVHDAVSEMRQNRSGVPSDLTGDSTIGYGSMR